MNTMTKLGNTTAMVLALAFTGSAALAQDLDDTTLLGRVILGYAGDGTPVTAGENTTTVDSEDLAEQGGVESLDDILRQQTSVFTLEDPSHPGVSVNIRGFEGSGRVAVAVDGVPQNFRITGHAAQSFAFVDENLLSSIDITRGATTTAGGTGIAGSVNFRTISAADVVRDGAGTGGLVRLRYGENGDDFSGMFATGYMDDRFEALVAYADRNVGNYADGDGTTVDFTGEDTGSILAKFAYHIDGSQTVSFSALNYQTEFAANSYAQELDSNTYTVGYDYDAGNGLLNLDVNLYYSEIDDRYVEYVGTSPFGGGSVGRQMITRTTGLDATNISEHSVGAWSLTSINGLEYSRDDLAGSGGGVNPTTGTTTRAALFSENIFSQGDWEITAGVRAVSYGLEGDQMDETYTSIDPKLTVAYWVNDWLQPYVTVSRATRAPTLQETMLGGSAHSGMAGMIANPELRPEQSTGYELGFNIERNDLFASGDQLSGRVNYYHMDVEDYVTASYPGTFTNVFGDTGIAFINVPGTAQTSGIEVELNYVNDIYEVGLSYTKNDSDMPTQISGLGAGQYLPDETISVRLAGFFMEDRLTLGAQYNYVSGGLYSALYSPTPVQRDDDYELVDLFAIYEVSDNVVLNAKVTNVFDETYVPWLSSDDNGPGRSFYVGAEMRF